MARGGRPPWDQNRTRRSEVAMARGKGARPSGIGPAGQSGSL